MWGALQGTEILLRRLTTRYAAVAGLLRSVAIKTVGAVRQSEWQERHWVAITTR
jgi:hypothetical protein